MERWEGSGLGNDPKQASGDLTVHHPNVVVWPQLQSTRIGRVLRLG